MKFIIHEIKLWFNKPESVPKSYFFLPNKINVITGDSTTGKTSFWNIIDYCLLSPKNTIPTEIISKTAWFGIRFTINDKEISIVRMAPEKNAVSGNVFFGIGSFPRTPEPNKEIGVIKELLDNEFGINENLKFPFGKGAGKSSLNLSYRHFLIFNSITQTIIQAPQTYFDSTFYGKKEYDKALPHLLDIALGVNDVERLKAIERIADLEKRIKRINTKQKSNKKVSQEFESNIFSLIERCKQNNFLGKDYDYKDTEEAIATIKEIISNTKEVIHKVQDFSEIDTLKKQRFQINSRIRAIERYEKEYKSYRRNLKKSVDSLQPIEYLNKELSDQLLDSYDTKTFLEYLENSLKKIKGALPKKEKEPLKVSGNKNILKNQLKQIDSEIDKLNKINKNFIPQGAKFLELGKIELLLKQYKANRQLKNVDTEELNILIDEKDRMKSKTQDHSIIKQQQKSQLNEAIQKHFDRLSSIDKYKGSKVTFNDERMVLELTPIGQLFSLDNVGSASNYMFMHLCLYLGLHEHTINLQQENIPPFLFIDQPSTPYYEGNNDDKKKLLDAFRLLNSFMNELVIERNIDFQIFMVEHAPKEYWLKNDFSFFHTVDEFIDGKGLIPAKIYND